MKQWCVFTAIIFYIMPILGIAQELKNTQATASPSIPIHSQIYFFNQHWQLVIAPISDGYYRKVLIISSNRYTVQDFYQNSNRKQSDPFTFIDPADLIKGIPTSIHGKLILWHENGQKNIEVSYNQGKKQGLLTVWHSNGEKELEQYYTNDKENGFAVFWNNQGYKELEIHFTEGLPDYVSLWKDGYKISEKRYKNGKQEGITTYWDNQGNTSAIETYQNNKLNGPSITYYQNMAKHSEFIYEDNRIKQITLWHKDNQKAAYLKRHTNKTKCSIWNEQNMIVYQGDDDERCILTIRNILK